MALLVDGIWAAEHTCVVALGITLDGTIATVTATKEDAAA